MYERAWKMSHLRSRPALVMRSCATARRCQGPRPLGVLMVVISAAMAQQVGAEAAATGPATTPGVAAGKVGGGGGAAIALNGDDRAQYWFGVAVENIPPTVAKQLKLKPDQGLMVVAVLPDSPAERAGLKAEDLLVELDGVPLTSQEDLARAANTNPGTYRVNGEVQLATPLMKMSAITFLREGDRQTVNVMPALRPESMLVLGDNRANFMVQNGRGMGNAPGAANNAAAMEVRNVVLPNGTTAQVGPGYRVDLTGAAAGNGDRDDGASTLVVQSIKQLMERGETVVLTQQTDGAGNVKNRITAGGKSYAVETGKVELLPAELRPLAMQLLAGSPAPSKVGTDVASAAKANAIAVGGTPAVGGNALEQRVSDLEKQNQALQEQLKELIGLMQKQNANR